MAKLNLKQQVAAAIHSAKEELQQPNQYETRLDILKVVVVNLQMAYSALQVLQEIESK